MASGSSWRAARRRSWAGPRSSRRSTTTAGRGRTWMCSCWHHIGPRARPDHVVTESDPVRLLGRMQTANKGGDVHLIGGPKTIETYRRLGALAKLEVVVVPLLFGGGMQLTPAISADAGLTYESARGLPGGSVEIVY